jgi:dephospho-CoA kinase
MKLIGLTGGIACGKTTAADVLREIGVEVIDADRVSREVVALGTDGLAQVAAAFGAGVLRSDGSLDREALGVIVMADPAARSALERITHPLIQGEIAQRIQQRAMAGDSAIVVEAALLVETGSWRQYDGLWVVRASREIQIQRLMKRKSCSSETAARWVDSQLPVEEKVRHADVVLDNDTNIEKLSAQVLSAWAELQGQDYS